MSETKEKPKKTRSKVETSVESKTSTTKITNNKTTKTKVSDIGNPDLLDCFNPGHQNKIRISRKQVLFGNRDPYGAELLALINSTQIVECPTPGQIVESTYMGLTADQFTFDISYKDYVRIDDKPNEARYLKETKPGSKVDILITSVSHSPLLIKGSISSIYETKAHNQLQSLEEDKVVEAFIREMNPAGYDVDILLDGLTIPAFMPNTLAGINKLHDPSEIVGQTFEVMVESFSDEKVTYIVSRRRYLQTLIPNAMSQLETQTVYDGVVTGTKEFGVFVEFNECLTGMIHRTNMLPEWQDRISEIKPGTKIQFYVKEIIKDKVILTQILKESLWDVITIGQKITGKVKENKPFGCLVILDEETMGLIHTSELEKSSTKTLNPGDEISVKVIAADRSNRKIYLTLNTK